MYWLRVCRRDTFSTTTGATIRRIKKKQYIFLSSLVIFQKSSHQIKTCNILSYNNMYAVKYFIKFKNVVQKNLSQLQSKLKTLYYFFCYPYFSIPFIICVLLAIQSALSLYFSLPPVFFHM